MIGGGGRAPATTNRKRLAASFTHSTLTSVTVRMSARLRIGENVYSEYQFSSGQAEGSGFHRSPHQASEALPGRWPLSALKGSRCRTGANGGFVVRNNGRWVVRNKGATCYYRI